MSLHILTDLEQGSDEWLEARRGIVTASVVGKLITPSLIKPASNVESRALTAELAAERITGWVEPGYVSDDMARGHDNEPDAANTYSEHYQPVSHIGFMYRDDWGFRIGLSPDGLVNDDGLIEIKSRKPKIHVKTVLTDEVPAENIAQIQCALLVSGRDWCDYISYSPGMSLWVKRVEPDPRWQDAIVAAAAAVEDTVNRMVTDYLEAVDGLPMTERIADYTNVELKL